ncbi:MAG TPA: peptidase M20, partial [Erysipelotrichaceae bacterium]|nr:peptidase M20 [Erysipelotrichaceae bacterium]
SGFEDLTYYLSKEKPPVMGWTPDCKYPVVYGERGRANLQIRADQAHLRQFFSFVTTYFLESAASGNRLGIDYHDDEYGEMQMRGYALRTEQEDVVFQFTLSYPACCSIQDIQKQIRTKLD